MNTHADETQENKSQTVTAEASQIQSGGESTFQFVDNRPEAIAQRKLQEMANNSPQVSQLRAFQAMANNSPQAKQTAQLQTMADNHSSQQQQPIQRQENKTGLPDNLKTGMENLSGMSLDDVKVHRNSDKPAQLQAHAYAQGNDIHLGPSQEKHLPHELGHVVQQKEGRVKPTMQMKSKVNINDDQVLEKEADSLGLDALRVGLSQPSLDATTQLQAQNNTIQLHGKLADLMNNVNELVSEQMELESVKEELKEPILNLAEIYAKRKLQEDPDINFFMYYSYLLEEVETRLSLRDEEDEGLEEEGEEGGDDEGPSHEMSVFGQDFTLSEGGVGTEVGPAAFNFSKDGVTIDLPGLKLELGKDSQKASGSFDESMSIAPLEGVGFNMQIPIPAPVPVFAEVGIDPILDMSLEVAGSYEYLKTKEKTILKIAGSVTGSAEVGLKMRAGVGVGAANIIGVSGGIYGAASAAFDASGTFGGKVVNESPKTWSRTTLNLGVDAMASLKGSAGTYLKANVAGYSREKRFGLVAKEFGLFDYSKMNTVEKTGVGARDLMPTISDFKDLICPPDALQDGNDWSDTAPLLSSSVRSDDPDPEEEQADKSKKGIFSRLRSKKPTAYQQMDD
jgi:hypothetical protein